MKFFLFVLAVALFAGSSGKVVKNDVTSVYDLLRRAKVNDKHTDAAKVDLGKAINNEVDIPYATEEEKGKCLQKELRDIVHSYFGLKDVAQKYIDFFKGIHKNLKEALDDLKHGKIPQAVMSITKAAKDIFSVPGEFKNLPQQMLDFLKKYMQEEIEKFQKCFSVRSDF